MASAKITTSVSLARNKAGSQSDLLSDLVFDTNALKIELFSNSMVMSRHHTSTAAQLIVIATDLFQSIPIPTDL